MNVILWNFIIETRLLPTISLANEGLESKYRTEIDTYLLIEVCRGTETIVLNYVLG